jgi:hypothetical protein
MNSRIPASSSRPARVLPLGMISLPAALSRTASRGADRSSTPAHTRSFAVPRLRRCNIRAASDASKWRAKGVAAGIAKACNPDEFPAWMEGRPGPSATRRSSANSQRNTRLARSFGPEALSHLVEMMRNVKLPAHVRFKAIEAIFNRGFATSRSG